MALSLGDPWAQGFTKYPDPTTDTVNAIFKEFYLPSVHDLLNSKRIVTYFLRRNRKDVSGEMAVLSLRTGRNEGMNFIGEGGLLPEPGRQRYQRATYRMRYDYIRILFTGPSVASSRNERGAFIRVLDAEIRGAAQDKIHDNNRVMFGDGSGRLATVAGLATTDLEIENPGGFVNTGPGIQYVRPGMRLGVVEAGSTDLRTLNGAGALGGIVTSVDPSTNEITMSDAAGASIDFSGGTVAAGDYLVKVSEAGPGSATTYTLSYSYLNEPFGLAALVDEGNPHGGATPTPNFHNVGSIDASAVAVWNAAVIDSPGAPVLFTQDKLQQAHDALDLLSDGHVGLWITTHGIRRQYLNQLVANKRYVNSMSLDGGWSALEYNGKPLVVDKDCTRGRIYGLDLDTLHLFEETDYAWIDQNGSILHRLENQDAFQATLYKYWQMGTNARNRNVVIKDLIDA